MVSCLARWNRIVLLAGGLVLAMSGAGAAQVDPDLEPGLQRLEQQLEVVKELRTQMPRDRFDPAAVVAVVGTDPVALFDWVVRETDFVPYQGALRGPTGVLMDRRGNSLDRALLLDTLLKSAGHSPRVVRATLDESSAAELIAGIEPGPAPGQLDQPADELLTSYSSRLGISASELRDATLAAAAEQRRLAELAADRTSSQSELLLNLVGTDSAEDISAYRQRQAAAVRDHWWVQVQSGGSWLDLDPTLPEAAPGTVVTAAQQGLVLSDLSQLGGQWLQQIVVRVIVEVWEDGTLREEIPIEVTVTPAEHPGQLLLFRQSPSEWPEDFDLFAADNPLEALRTTLLEQQRWTPAFAVAGEQVSDRSFTLDGVLDAAATNSNAAAVGGMGMGAGGMFGGFGGAAAGAEPASAEVTAEWLEFELRVPGSEPVVTRRPLFDLLGAEVRAAGAPAELELTEVQQIARATALFGEIEMLPLVGELPSTYVDLLHLDTLIANMEVAVGVFRGGALEDFEQLLEAGQELLHNSPLYGYALARSAWSDNREDVYVASANLISYHRRLVVDAGSGLSVREGFDIVLNSVGVLSDDPFRARVEQGVLDTNAEALLLAERLPEAQVRNASEAALAGATVMSGALVNVPPRIRSQVSADLAAGFVVVLPKSAEEDFTWWRIDPRTGETLGMGETGWGQAMAEYAEQTQIVLQLKSQLEFYRDMGRCLGLALTGPLRGQEGPDSELRKCVFNLICSQIDDAISTPFDIDTNWTNVIVQKTIDDTYGSLCSTAADKFF